MNPTPPPKITAEWLRAQHACSKQVETFAREWPAGAGITKANLLRAAALKLDLSWLARRVLAEPASEAYVVGREPAHKAYDTAVATEHKAYNAAVAVALWAAGSEHGWEVQA